MSTDQPLKDEPKPILPKALANNDRITTVLNLNYEHRGDEPFGTQIVLTELVSPNGEQPYTRRLTVPSEWKPIDIGWIEPEKVGAILLQNLEGLALTLNPTEEERQALDEKIVEVSYCQDGDRAELVRPYGGFYLGFPSSVKGLQYRSRGGSATCRIVVLPR